MSVIQKQLQGLKQAAVAIIESYLSRGEAYQLGPEEQLEVYTESGSRYPIKAITTEGVDLIIDEGEEEIFYSWGELKSVEELVDVAHFISKIAPKVEPKQEEEKVLIQVKDVDDDEVGLVFVRKEDLGAVEKLLTDEDLNFHDFIDEDPAERGFNADTMAALLTSKGFPAESVYVEEITMW